jgi:hypothetical protein
MEQTNELESCSDSTCDIFNHQEPSNKSIAKESQSLWNKQPTYSNFDINIILDVYIKFKKSYLAGITCGKEIKKHIKLAFCKQLPENLCRKFEYSCCRESLHEPKCLNKWKILKKKLLNVVDLLQETTKPIFAVNKKQNNRCRALLNATQPGWIHRIYLESLSVIGSFQDTVNE